LVGGRRWAYAQRVLPAVRYVRSGDASIAFQTFGTGPPDVLFVPGFVSHVDLAWEEPYLARFLRRLGSFSRVIWFDRVGTGVSDDRPVVTSLEDEVRDVEAVMDAAGCERAVHFGVAVGAGLCVHHAVQHPERVSALVLFAAHARLLCGPGYPAGWSAERYAAVLEQIDGGWSDGAVVAMMNPSVASDERFRSWFRRYCRAGASPGQVRRVFETCAAMDLVPLLDRLDVSTLLLHRIDAGWLSLEGSRFLEERIRGARLVELAGSDHWPWIGDADRVLAEVETFVTGRRPSPRRRPASGPEALTQREREVMRLAAEGASARAIGDRLCISERTAEAHIAHAYLKLGIHSRVELARRAEAFGL
jgi:pimeloyl-ACP methyl ester carboxylesterase/DNA-binding CsgD family transcriptional regulator